jgi:hypothetical protein
MKDGNVLPKLTSWLRAECDEELRDRISSKSLRKGANNELAMNCLIHKQERLIRGGGWAATDTSDTAAYLEVNPALTYPPMLALAGWPDPHAQIHPMRLPLDLGDTNFRSIQILAETIYLGNIEKFVKLPHILPPFMYTCVAAEVMYHPQMYIDHGPNNVVVEKMIDRVIESKLAATRESSHQLLCSWATTIKDEFRAQNKQVKRATEQNLVEVVNQQSVAAAIKNAMMHCFNNKKTSLSRSSRMGCHSFLNNSQHLLRGKHRHHQHLPLDLPVEAASIQLRLHRLQKDSRQSRQ